MPRTSSLLTSATRAMPTTRRAILLALKRRGSMRANDLAEHLGITVAAVRQQLLRLSQDGLVTHHRDADGRGRPSHSYELTQGAEMLFPKRYGDLTTELLGYLGGPDSTEVTELFEQRRRRRLAGAQPRLAEMPLDKQVAEAAAEMQARVFEQPHAGRARLAIRVGFHVGLATTGRDDRLENVVGNA